MIKVSILVPIYNVEKYLRECLDSCINQTLKEIEIICLNDGSTDSSLKIVKEYAAKDSRIVIVDKPNTGYGNNMNIGLDRATGEYVGIIESDDFAKIEMFEELYNIASKNELDLIITDYYKYWGKHKIKKAGATTKFPLNVITNIKTNPIILRNITTTWCSIYKREFLEKNTIRHLETPGASYQDTSFRFKAVALAKRIMCISKAYVYYRQNNENSSVKSKGKVYAICDEYTEINKFLNNNPEIKRYANSEKIINQWHGYNWNLTRIDNSFRKDFAIKYQKEFKEYYENNELDEYFYKFIYRTDIKILFNNLDDFIEIFSNHKVKRILMRIKLKLKYLLLKFFKVEK